MDPRHIVAVVSLALLTSGCPESGDGDHLPDATVGPDAGPDAPLAEQPPAPTITAPEAHALVADAVTVRGFGPPRATIEAVLTAGEERVASSDTTSDDTSTSGAASGPESTG